MQNDERPVGHGPLVASGRRCTCEYVRNDDSPHVPQAALKVRLMEPLVLIHGFSGIPAMWDPMLPALQERFDVRAARARRPLRLRGAPGRHGCERRRAVRRAGARPRRGGLRHARTSAATRSAAGRRSSSPSAAARARASRSRPPAAGRPARRRRRGSSALFTRLHKTSNWAEPHAEKLFPRPRLRKLAFRDAVEHGERMTPRQAAEHGARLAHARSTGTSSTRSSATARRPTSTASTCPTTIVWGSKDRILPLKGYSERDPPDGPAGRFDRARGRRATRR